MTRPPITRNRPYTPKTGKVAGITFTSERQYRNALARQKGYSSWSAQQKQARKVRSGHHADSLRPSEREARRRALDALSLMRSDGLSLGKAARAAGTTPNAIKRHAGSALARGTRGRYVAKPTDKLVRTMEFPTEQGTISLDIRDSRTAHRLGMYWNAVKRYLETGDASGLDAFRGRHIRVNKRSYVFVTDTRILDRLADAGELVSDDIYSELSEAA